MWVTRELGSVEVVASGKRVASDSCNGSIILLQREHAVDRVFLPYSPQSPTRSFEELRDTTLAQKPQPCISGLHHGRHCRIDLVEFMNEGARDALRLRRMIMKCI